VNFFFYCDWLTRRIHFLLFNIETWKSYHIIIFHNTNTVIHIIYYYVVLYTIQITRTIDFNVCQNNFVFFYSFRKIREEEPNSGSAYFYREPAGIISTNIQGIFGFAVSLEPREHKTCKTNVNCKYVKPWRVLCSKTLTIFF